MHLPTPHTLLLLILPLTLDFSASAQPLRKPTTHRPAVDTASSLTEAQVLTISPNANTCDNAPAEGECATAKIAAQYTAQSFDNYKVTSKAEQAAIVSLMAFESGDFKYNKNHFPGVAGQGSKFDRESFLENEREQKQILRGRTPFPKVGNTKRERFLEVGIFLLTWLLFKRVICNLPPSTRNMPRLYRIWPRNFPRCRIRRQICLISCGPMRHMILGRGPGS